MPEVQKITVNDTVLNLVKEKGSKNGESTFGSFHFPPSEGLIPKDIDLTKFSNIKFFSDDSSKKPLPSREKKNE